MAVTPTVWVTGTVLAFDRLKAARLTVAIAEIPVSARQMITLERQMITFERQMNIFGRQMMTVKLQNALIEWSAQTKNNSSHR